MADKVIENNQVSIIGKVVSGFTFSHEVFGEGFYMVELSVKRLSDSSDRIPVMISERLIDVAAGLSGRVHTGGRTVPVIQPARRKKEPSGAVCICQRDFICGRSGR